LARQQVYWLCIGIVASFLVAAVDYRVLNRWAYPLYASGLVGLASCSFSAECQWGAALASARRIGAQPSEMMSAHDHCVGQVSS